MEKQIEKSCTLEEVLDSSQLVFFDNSCLRYINNNFIENELLSKLFGIDLFGLRLDEFVKDIEESASLLYNPIRVLDRSNVFTIPEVTQELKRLNSIVSGFYKKIGDGIENSCFNLKHDKKVKVKEAVKKLKDATYDIYEFSKRKSLVINDLKYEILCNMAYLISSAYKLKKSQNLKPKFDPRSIKKLLRDDSETDERLAAVLFYYSAFLNTPTALITADTDFVGLTAKIPNVIASDAFIPFNYEFKRALKLAPFKTYLIREGKINLPVDSRRLHPFRFVYSDYISQEENERFIGSMKVFWERLNPLYDEVQNNRNYSYNKAVE